MLVLRLREPKVALAALSLVVLLALLLLADLRREVEYAEEAAARLPWGEGEGALGLPPLRDGRRQAPPSFAVGPRGRVWVVDAARGRLLGLDPGSGIAAVWPLPTLQPPPRIVDLAVRADGGLVLADAAGRRLVELDPAGALRRVVALPPELAPAGDDPLFLLERVAVDPVGLVYLAHAAVTDQSYTRGLARLEGEDGRLARVAQVVLREGGVVEVGGETLLPGPVDSFAVDGHGNVLVEAAGDDPFHRRVRLFDALGRARAEWLVGSDVAVRDAAVLGRDPLGGIVLLLNPGTPQGRLLRLDEQGRTTYERPVPWDPGFAQSVHGRMDAQGDLYLAVPDASGWNLLRLRLRTRWRLVPAGLP